MQPALISSKHTRSMVALLVALSVLHSGCVDLKEVRAFAETASEVGDRFPALARDLHDSCMAQQRYIVAQREDFRVDQFADLNDPANPLLEPVARPASCTRTSKSG